IRCNESGEVPAASWDHNITVQENIRSPQADITIEPLQLYVKAQLKCPLSSSIKMTTLISHSLY
ncbi:hypothetical protein ACLH2F_34985, partial [Klebsiella grimontii]